MENIFIVKQIRNKAKKKKKNGVHKIFTLTQKLFYQPKFCSSYKSLEGRGTTMGCKSKEARFESEFDSQKVAHTSGN